MKAATALNALGQETRLEIFRRLVQAGPGGKPAGAIGAALGVSHPVLSFHLAQLKAVDLVSVRRLGRQQIYSARFDTMAALMAYLTENCCAGACGSGAPTTGESNEEIACARGG